MGYIMDMVEIFLCDIFDFVFEHIRNVSALLETEYPNIRLPFARITYREALRLLNNIGHNISFSQNISKHAENLLTNQYGGPVWLMYKPRNLEPFPYRICPTDEKLWAWAARNFAHMTVLTGLLDWKSVNISRIKI